jgi:ribosomal-protein-alanine N-acetyltransferase
MNSNKMKPRSARAHALPVTPKRGNRRGRITQLSAQKADPNGVSAQKKRISTSNKISDIRFHIVRSAGSFPPGFTIAMLARFLHESLKPYEDSPQDIRRGIRDALQTKGRKGGFLIIAESGSRIVGALVMHRTGMKGYIPENLLLFVAVAPNHRGNHLGSQLIERAIQEAKGDIKLHVEYNNPARRLYERIGFVSKYAEMRYLK